MTGKLYLIDYSKLRQATRERKEQYAMTWEDVNKEVGFGVEAWFHSYNRLRSGTLMRLLAWFNSDFAKFVEE